MANTSIQSYVLKELQDGKELTSEMIKLLVEDFTPIARKKKKLYDRYTVQDVPIFDRPVLNGTKVNNLINNDFAGEIIDQKVSHTLGNSIRYSIDKTSYEEDDSYRKHQGHVNRFVVRNTMADLDIELGKLVSISGTAGREIYIDKEGNERIANIPAWEAILLTDSVGKVEYGFRLRTELRKVEDDLRETLCVDFYNDKEITYYVERLSDDGTSDGYTKDVDREENPKNHLLNRTPLIKVDNNEEEMGDFERVLSLIDAYDRTMSDVNSEIEQFRMAYMYFKGVKVNKDTIAKAKDAGGFEIPEDGDIGFITKNMSDTYVENHLKHLEENINRFAKHVNMSAQDFGGGDSSLANKYKLSALEMKSMVLEVKMKSALLKQFEILTSAWNIKGIDIDYLDVLFTFSRNLPINVLEEADENVKLKGLVSERTRLGRFSFVDDVDYEIDEMEADKLRSGLSIEKEEDFEDIVNLDSIKIEQEGATEVSIDGEE